MFIYYPVCLLVENLHFHVGLALSLFLSREREREREREGEMGEMDEAAQPNNRD